MRTEFSSEKEKHNYFNRMTQEQKLDAMGEILACCRHVAFLGGAGVSTESGIPDFRSEDGLYNLLHDADTIIDHARNVLCRDEEA